MANPGDDQRAIRHLGQAIQSVSLAAKCVTKGAARRLLYREKSRLVDFAIKTYSETPYLDFSYQIGNYNETLLLVQFDFKYASHLPVDRLSVAASQIVTKQLGRPSGFNKDARRRGTNAAVGPDG